MEPVIRINKFDAFIELGKLNQKSVPWSREKLLKLNSIINANLNQEIELGEYRNYIEVSSDNKKFMQQMGLSPVIASKNFILHNVLLKIVMFFWR